MAKWIFSCIALNQSPFLNGLGTKGAIVNTPNFKCWAEGSGHDEYRLVVWTHEAKQRGSDVREFLLETLRFHDLTHGLDKGGPAPQEYKTLHHWAGDDHLVMAAVDDVVFKKVSGSQLNLTFPDPKKVLSEGFQGNVGGAQRFEDLLNDATSGTISIKSLWERLPAG